MNKEEGGRGRQVRGREHIFNGSDRADGGPWGVKYDFSVKLAEELNEPVEVLDIVVSNRNVRVGLS